MRTLSSRTKNSPRFRVANQINAANMRMDAARDFDADYFPPEMRAGIDKRTRNLAVPENALLAINILQEKIQRYHALGQAALNFFPLRIRQDARDQIEGKQALGAAAVTVNRESNALNKEREVRQFPAFLELPRLHGDKFLVHLGILRARNSRRGEHLVIKVPRVVSIEQAAIDHVG